MLLSITEHYISGAVITSVPRKYFNEQMGHDYIQQLAFPDEIASIKIAVSAKFYAISAAAAALKHIEICYVRFAMHSLRIKYQASEGLLSPLLLGEDDRLSRGMEQVPCSSTLAPSTASS